MRRLPRRGRLVAAIAIAAALAAGNVVREACWTQADGFLCGPFATQPYGTRLAAIPVAGLARVEVPAPSWRPLSLTLRVDGGGPARVSAGTAGGGVSIAPGTSTVVRVDTASTTPDRVVLWAEAPGAT